MIILWGFLLCMLLFHAMLGFLKSLFPSHTESLFSSLIQTLGTIWDSDLAGMLEEYAAVGVTFCESTVDSEVKDEYSIMACAAATRDLVNAKAPGHSEGIKRRLSAAVSLMRARLVDIGLREHCYVLRVIAVGDHVRAHDG